MHRFPLTSSALLLLPLLAACDWTTNISVNSAGEPGTSVSSTPSPSADGRVVAFMSFANNLVDDDTNGDYDVFLHDTVERITVRVSVDSQGNEANGHSRTSTISDDGRYIAFDSAASNLIPNDTNNAADIFVHDHSTGIIQRLSVDSEGTQSNSFSIQPMISGNGRYVAFTSFAANLVAVDNNAVSDIFVHDRDTGTTVLVSVDSAGNQANAPSELPTISDNGRYIAFQSDATNLVASDTNNAKDVFLHDRDTGITTRVSVDSVGNEADAESGNARISGGGRYTAFESLAGNLVADDNNGVKDIFVHDHQTSMTSRVNLDSAGAETSVETRSPDFSNDGRYVVFDTYDGNLVEGDNNDQYDVFLRDRSTGVTSRVSLDALGGEGNGGSYDAVMSANGRYVTFKTAATNLAEVETNGDLQIIMRAIPGLSVDGVVPAHIPAGATTSIIITGANFLPGSEPVITGQNRTISNIIVVDENTITADITVDPAAVPGSRSVAVKRPGTGAGPLSGVAAICEDCITFQ